MNKREKIYRALRDDITFGELEPGEKLIELDICEKFKVSRTPVREALRLLQSEGYIDVSVNKGAVVRKVSIEELKNIFDILAFLDACAVESATRYVTRKDIDRLKKLTTRLNNAKSSDFGKVLDLNNAFHEFFAKNSRNPLLYNEIKKMRNKIYRSRGILYVNFLGNRKKHNDDHEMILKYVEKGEAVKAGNKMKSHIQKSIKSFIKRNI